MIIAGKLTPKAATLVILNMTVTFVIPFLCFPAGFGFNLDNLLSWLCLKMRLHH